jgi:hypothetical protein
MGTRHLSQLRLAKREFFVQILSTPHLLVKRSPIRISKSFQYEGPPYGDFRKNEKLLFKNLLVTIWDHFFQGQRQLRDFSPQTGEKSS